MGDCSVGLMSGGGLYNTFTYYHFGLYLRSKAISCDERKLNGCLYRRFGLRATPLLDYGEYSFR